jgi:hypothetical protein
MSAGVEGVDGSGQLESGVHAELGVGARQVRLDRMLADVEVDAASFEEFLERFFTDLGAVMHASTVLIGDRLGLFRAMADCQWMAPEDWPPPPARTPATSANGSVPRPAFPASRFVGFDYHEGSIALARRAAAAAGVVDRCTFETATAKDYPGTEYGWSPSSTPSTTWATPPVLPPMSWRRWPTTGSG